MLEDSVFDGISINRITAIDGKKHNINSILLSSITNKNSYNSVYEYACLLSHLNSIKQFWDSTQQISLIMEDDMTLELKAYWKMSLSEYISNAPFDWDILQLTYISRENITPPSLYSKWKYGYYSTGAYIINRQGANKIMKLYIDNKWCLPNNITHESDILIYSLCNTYTTKYPFFIYSSTNTSEIHQEHISFHNNSKARIMKLYN